MLRTKLQSKKNLGYRELVLSVQTTIKDEGIFCMWKGIGPTLFRDVPFSGRQLSSCIFFSKPLCIRVLKAFL